MERIPSTAARRFIWAGLLVCSLGSAQQRIIDGDDADWPLPGPTLSNLAQVVRDDAGRGTLVWRDAPGDAQTALNDPESEADLTELRISGSAQALQVLLRFSDLVLASGPGAVQVQLAVDTDRAPGSGSLAFIGGADLDVTDAARWEYLVATAFGSNSGQLTVHSAGGGSQQAGIAVINPMLDVAELSLPWSAMGLAGPPDGPLALSIATFRSNADDSLMEVGDALAADALDVITHNNQPGVARPSSDELTDQVLDHQLLAWFQPDGQVRAPLLISAVQPRPSSMIAGEFVRLFNPGSTSLELQGFAVGDEETPGATEGMFSLPAFPLAAGAQVTVARSSTAYEVGAGSPADFETEMSDPAVPSLGQDSVWAIGGIELVDSGDQVLLLDPSRTVIDVIAYGSATYVGVEALGPVNGGDTFQRAPRERDRNLADDFRFLVSDLSLAVTGPAGRLLENSEAVYIVRATSTGPDAVTDASVRLEQLDGLAVEGSQCQNVSAGAVCAPLDPVTLESLVSLAPGDSFEIAVQARAGSAATADALLAARITAPSTVGELAPLDNFDASTQSIEPEAIFSDGYESEP